MMKEGLVARRGNRRAAELAQGRMDALQTQWESAMGDTPFDLVSPKAQAAFKRLLGDEGTAPPAGGGGGRVYYDSEGRPVQK